MTIEPGTNLLHYRIVEKIGEGGMGVVWSAEDTVLKRDVALKFLPASYDRDPKRLAQFQREARFLASLNHTNIAAIHGFEEADGERFLIMELVPGMSLAQRVKKGPLPVEEALKVCCDIARALEAAHEKGVIHRDLKPANVQITPKGEVKVLDFGLAKAFGAVTTPSEASQQATVTVGTAEHTIVGTAPYMSPEQASAKELDKRTDIWSFGCILYELLTGQRAFTGDTVSSTIVAIHSQDPNWERLPGDTPRRIRQLLGRCLEKDADRRLHDIADGRLEIDDALSAREWATPATTVAAAPLAKRSTALPRVLPWVVAVGMTVVAISALWRPGNRSEPERQIPVRVTIPILSGVELPTGPEVPLQFDVSPDRRYLVYVGRQASPEVTQGLDRTRRLYLRSLDTFETRVLLDTEGATQPFFSPDGVWVGFFSGFQIKKVPLAGGAPVTIHTMKRPGLGADWGADGTIVFGVGWSGGLRSISQDGGEPKPLTRLDKGEVSHRWPRFIPGGKAVLYTIKHEDISSFDDGWVGAVSLKSGQSRVLAEGGMDARYSPTGHLVFGRGNSLFAVPFDEERLEVTGQSGFALDGIATDPWVGVSHFRLSLDGTLFYLAGSDRRSRRIPSLAWIDREGNVTESLTPTDNGIFEYPRLSPDGRKLAVSVVRATDHIWILDLDRGTFTRLTFGQGNHTRPCWTPDGTRIVFVSGATGAEELRWVPVDGSAEPESLGTWEGRVVPTSISPDGELLIYHTWGSATGSDIHVLSLTGERETRPFLTTPYNEGWAVFSPNGHWIAYESNESGRAEVYVRPYPGPGRKIQISPGGGQSPRWSRDGQLFYRNRDAMMVVEIGTTSGFVAGTPRRLFEARFSDFSVSTDGQRFLVVPSEEPESQSRIHVVLNWSEELKRKLAAAQ